MTRDDIYRMAQEAGFMTLCINEDTWIPYLSRFAKLVAAAAKREWHGLTDEERTFLAWESNNGSHCVAITEAKLKEKNT